MPKSFAGADPKDITVGRGRSFTESLLPYVETVTLFDAGVIELSPDEKPGSERRKLSLASKQVGKRIRCGYVPSTNTLEWKIVAPKQEASPESKAVRRTRRGK